MALVPIMPVDLFELSNNHVWQTEFAFREFGEAPAAWMGVERDAKGFTERGWIEFGFRNYYALLDCGFRLRPTAGTASGVHPVPLGFGRVYVRLDGGLDAARLAPRPGRGAELRDDRPDAPRHPGRARPRSPLRAGRRRRPASTACGVRPSARCRWNGSRS